MPDYKRSIAGEKKVTNGLRLHGNPNWPGRGGNPKGPPKGLAERKKIFSEVLHEIYTGKGGRKRLKKLALVCIQWAEDGHARFAELILDRLEGPVKHEPSTVNNLNIFSEADRQRAISVVDDILAMDRKTINLPQLQESVCAPTASVQNLDLPTSSSSETPDSKPQTTD